jgi:hypothetical protein
MTTSRYDGSLAIVSAGKKGAHGYTPGIGWPRQLVDDNWVKAAANQKSPEMLNQNRNELRNNRRYVCPTNAWYDMNIFAYQISFGLNNTRRKSDKRPHKRIGARFILKGSRANEILGTFMAIWCTTIKQQLKKRSIL